MRERVPARSRRAGRIMDMTESSLHGALLSLKLSPSIRSLVSEDQRKGSFFVSSDQSVWSGHWAMRPCFKDGRCARGGETSDGARRVTFSLRYVCASCHLFSARRIVRRRFVGFAAFKVVNTERHTLTSGPQVTVSSGRSSTNFFTRW